MSVSALQLFDKHRSNYTPSQRIVFRYLCEKHNEKGGFYCKRETIAEYTDVSLRTISRTMEQLEKDGLITRYETAIIKTGRRGSNIIFINGVDSWDIIYSSKKFPYVVPLDPHTSNPMWYVVF